MPPRRIRSWSRGAAAPRRALARGRPSHARNARRGGPGHRLDRCRLDPGRVSGGACRARTLRVGRAAGRGGHAVVPRSVRCGRKARVRAAYRARQAHARSSGSPPAQSRGREACETPGSGRGGPVVEMGARARTSPRRRPPRRRPSGRRSAQPGRAAALGDEGGVRPRRRWAARPRPRREEPPAAGPCPRTAKAPRDDARPGGGAPAQRASVPSSRARSSSASRRAARRPSIAAVRSASAC